MSVLVLLIILAAPFAQQRVAPPAGSALIGGVVVDGATGQPVPGALVTLDGNELPGVFADGLGRFVFPGIRPKAYEVGATKPGFAALETDARQRRITVSDGQRKLDVRITLWRLGSLNGRVTDDRGDPIVRAQVGAFRRFPTGDGSSPLRVASARTDDRGVYRLFDLPPGDYMIAASRTALPSIGDIVALSAPTTAEVEPRTFRSIAPLSRDLADETIKIFPPKFYTNAQTFRDATTVTLTAGDDRHGLDLMLAERAVVSVSGSVITNGAGLELGARAFDLTPVVDGEPAAGLGSYIPEDADGSGSFAFKAVPHGNYMLTVTAMAVESEASMRRSGEVADLLPYWASLPVTVAGAGVVGLQPVMRPGVRLSGSASFATGAPPAAEAIEDLRIVFDSADARARFGVARIAADGSFAVRGLVPGRYALAIQGPAMGLHVKSISIGGMDATDLPISVGADAIANVKITVAGQTDYASISGTVPQAVGSRSGPWVLLFPVDRRLWQEPRAAGHRFRLAETDARGAFTIPELVPGEYFLMATDQPPGDWRNVARLGMLSRTAARIVVSAGESRIVAVAR